MKKSQEFDHKYIYLIIIGLIVLAISIHFFVRYEREQKIRTEDEICKESVYANAIMRIGTLNLAKELQPKCPTRVVKIKERDDEKAKLQIANYMYHCADNFGNGKLELFEDEEAIFCAVCDYITIERDDIKNFNEYLNTKKLIGKDITYADYLQGSETEEFSKVVKNLPEEAKQVVNLEKGKSYGIIFVYIKGKNNVKNFQKVVTAENAAGKIGYGAGAVGGATVAVLILKGAALAGATIATGGTALIIIGGAAVVGAVAGVLTAHAVTNTPEYMGFTYITEYNDEELKKIGCDVLVTTFENKE